MVTYILFQDGSQHLVKEVHTGDSIHSLLSILDVLTVSVWAVRRFTLILYHSIINTFWM